MERVSADSVARLYQDLAPLRDRHRKTESSDELMSVTIYKLVDPRDSKQIPWYVGKARDPKDRIKRHIRQPHSIIMRRWIDKLRRAHVKPTLIVLRVVSDQDRKSVV